MTSLQKKIPVPRSCPSQLNTDQLEEVIRNPVQPPPSPADRFHQDWKMSDTSGSSDVRLSISTLHHTTGPVPLAPRPQTQARKYSSIHISSNREKFSTAVPDCKSGNIQVPSLDFSLLEADGSKSEGSQDDQLEEEDSKGSTSWRDSPGFIADMDFGPIRSAASLALERIMGAEDAANVQRCSLQQGISRSGHELNIKSQQPVVDDRVEQLAVVTNVSKEILFPRQESHFEEPNVPPKMSGVVPGRHNGMQVKGSFPPERHKLKTPTVPQAAHREVDIKVVSGKIMFPVSGKYNLVEDVLSQWREEFSDAPLGIPPPYREIPPAVVLKVLNERKFHRELCAEAMAAAKQRQNEEAAELLLRNLCEQLQTGGSLSWQQFQEIIGILDEPVKSEDILRIDGHAAGMKSKALWLLEKNTQEDNEQKKPQDVGSIHYFCHEHQHTNPLPFPRLVTSVLGQPAVPGQQVFKQYLQCTQDEATSVPQDTGDYQVEKSLHSLWHPQDAVHSVEDRTDGRKPSHQAAQTNTSEVSQRIKDLHSSQSKPESSLGVSGEVKKIHPDDVLAQLEKKLDEELARVEAFVAAEKQKAIIASRTMISSSTKTSTDDSHQQVIEGEADDELAIEGQALKLSGAPHRFLWKPVPCRLFMAPRDIQVTVCHHYDPSTGGFLQRLHKEEQRRREEAEAALKVDLQNTTDNFRTQLLQAHHNSISDLTVTAIHEDRLVQTSTDLIRRTFYSVLDWCRVNREQTAFPSAVSIDKLQRDGKEKPLRTWSSMTNLSGEPSVCAPTDFKTCMAEVEEQSRLLDLLPCPEQKSLQSSSVLLASRPSGTGSLAGGGTSTVLSLDGEERRKPTRKSRTSAKKARSEVKKVRSSSCQKRVKYLRQALSEEPSCLKRSTSMPLLHVLEKSEDEGDGPPSGHSTHDVLSSSHLSRSVSALPAVEFDKLKANSSNASDDPWNWAQIVWDKWFDEVRANDSRPSQSRQEKSLPFLVIKHTQPLRELQSVSPTEKNAELLKDLQNELVSLNVKLSSDDKQPILLCRRGAVYRKLGYLQEALADFNRTIDLEPLFLDAYWNRHLLRLVERNEQAAFDDIMTILKHRRTHARAWRARGEMEYSHGRLQSAIYSYSQVLLIQSNDQEAFFRRAKLHEEYGHQQSAMNDMSAVLQLGPTNAAALFQHGLYCARSGLWQKAVEHFTNLLAVDKYHVKAYAERGKVFLKQGQAVCAVRDFSAAVHLDPMNSECFFLRGCVLRKHARVQAVQDFSTSLLLDSSPQNARSFLHRGVLYAELGRYDEAGCDFRSAMRLNPKQGCARINLAIICIEQKHLNIALDLLNAAVRADPRNERALLCRGDVYQQLGKTKQSLHDYGRAVHLRPDIPEYHLLRGHVLLKENRTVLANIHLQVAAKLNSESKKGIPSAKADTYLGNYDEAVSTLKYSTIDAPKSDIAWQLGRTFMKAGKFDEASRSFLLALDMVAPNRSKDKAELQYQIGLCHEANGSRAKALQSFSLALRNDPRHAQARYQRGVFNLICSPELAIEDLNCALDIEPTLYEAFLARAAYFVQNGRLTKAVLNCSSAIHLQPTSVQAHLLSGSLKYHLKVYDGAVKDLSRTIALHPQCSLAFYNRACCYQARQMTEEAICDFSTVILMMDTDSSLKNQLLIPSLQNRAQLYLQTRQEESAIADLKEAIKLKPDLPKLYHCLAVVLHRSRMELQEAVEVFSSGLKQDPFMIESLIGRGNAYLDYCHPTGNVLSKRDYCRAIHLQPTQLAAYVNLGYHLQMQGHFYQAWKQFSSAIIMNERCQSAIEGRAMVCLQMSHFYAAMLDMNRAVSIKATADILNNRAVVHCYMDDLVNAMHDLSAARHLDPSHYLVLLNMGTLCTQQRLFPEALDCLNLAAKSGPVDDATLNNRAMVKAVLKDYDGALADLNTALEYNRTASFIHFNQGNVLCALELYSDAEQTYNLALQYQPNDILVLRARAKALAAQGLTKKAMDDYRQAIHIAAERSEQQLKI